MTPQVTQQGATTLTAVDLVNRFRPLPLSRVRFDPAPGTATEEGVVSIHDREGWPFELVVGILLEKTVGTYEAWLAMRLGRLLGNYVEEHDAFEDASSNGSLASKLSRIDRGDPGLVCRPARASDNQPTG